MRHPSSKILVLMGLMLLLGATAWAQGGAGYRVYQEQLRVALDKQNPVNREVGFDAGGWFTYGLFNYDDAGSLRTRTLQQFQVRGWASLNVRNVHKAYFRGLLNWDYWAANDNPNHDHRTDYSNPIERAWYEFDLGALIFNQTGKHSPIGFTMKIGREYMTIGSAYALSLPLDMIRFDTTWQNLHFMSFLANTVQSSPNIDSSTEVYDHQDRCFYGFQLDYQIDQHKPFIYYYAQFDHTNPNKPDAIQNYDYSSRYIGIGSMGTLLPDLGYSLELVKEWGQTYSEGAISGQDDIDAWGFDVMLNYDIPVKLSPHVMFEYMFGSGDGDRRRSSTATQGGNLIGTDDKAFNAFGFRDTGIAYSPEISNMNIFTVGSGFYPLEDVHWIFEKLEVGAKVFFYFKDVAGGPVSDTTANVNARWLGWEADFYANWRITSDLAWTMRYGCFQPGSDYASPFEGSRHFFYTAISLSF